jgi:hypothetical protein
LIYGTDLFRKFMWNHFPIQFSNSNFIQVQVIKSSSRPSDTLAMTSLTWFLPPTAPASSPIYCVSEAVIKLLKFYGCQLLQFPPLNRKYTTNLQWQLQVKVCFYFVLALNIMKIICFCC